MTGTHAAAHAVDEVLHALDLRETGPDAFAGDSLVLGMPRVFGGQVLAQCLLAAAHTVAAGAMARSLHATFVRAGDPWRPITFEVDRVRDGRRLAVRTVTARQGARTLVAATVSLGIAAGRWAAGIDTAAPMPSGPVPEDLPTLADHAARWGGLSEAWSGLDAVECRVNPHEQRHVWLRTSAPVGNDALVHQALLVYLSDITVLAASLVEHGVPMGVEVIAGRRYDGISLDHAVWFQRPVRVDRWLLFAHSSPSAADGRALGMASVYDVDGTFGAVVAQEGLVEVTDIRTGADR